jgi:hypothetical protein
MGAVAAMDSPSPRREDTRAAVPVSEERVSRGAARVSRVEGRASRLLVRVSLEDLRVTRPRRDISRRRGFVRHPQLIDKTASGRAERLSIVPLSDQEQIAVALSHRVRISGQSLHAQHPVTVCPAGSPIDEVSDMPGGLLTGIATGTGAVTITGTDAGGAMTTVTG